MGLGTLGLCGLLTQGTGCRVCSPTLPWHHPFFGVLSSDLGWSRQAKPWHVHGNPHEGLGASSPAPSAAPEPLLPAPPCLALLPGGPACFPYPTGDIFLPCPWVDLIHAWLYMQMYAGGSSLKGGEGSVPTDRGSSGVQFVAVFWCC